MALSGISIKEKCGIISNSRVEHIFEREFENCNLPFQQTCNQGSTYPVNSHSLVNQQEVLAPWSI